jgi:uncharacterized protein (DUF58 family)
MGDFLHSTTGSSWRDFRTLVREQLKQVDRAAWRRFFFAIFTLALSFFLALYSTAMRLAGHVELAAWLAAISLLLAVIVAIKVVPFLAKRTALERWMLKIEFEFTRQGVVYILIIVVIAVAALNTGNNLLFIILASMLAGILVSGILSQIVLSHLELEFVLPDHIFAGRPMISALTLHNLKWAYPSFSITVSACEPGRRKKRKLQESSTPARPILDSPVYVPYIPHRSSVTQHVELIFPKRGCYSQEGFRVSTQFPFGFLRKAHEIHTRHEILALPDVQPTEEFYEILPLISGEVESYYRGRGHDLYSIRDYMEGESARHVDWKATAKAQQLKIREFTREDERRVTLVFDPAVHDLDEKTVTKFEKAINFCACLAWHFYEIHSQMQFLSYGFETPMAPSEEIVYAVLEKLALIEPTVQVSESSSQLLSHAIVASQGFRIILTGLPQGSIPTNLWGTSYLVFIDSL